MEDVIDKAIYAMEVSLRKDGVDIDVGDSDILRDELQHILENNGYYEELDNIND
jgi:hypothetical protein